MRKIPFRPIKLITVVITTLCADDPNNKRLKNSLETFEEENEERNHESANLTRSRRDDKQTITILLIFISLSSTNWSKSNNNNKKKKMEFPIRKRFPLCWFFQQP